MSKQTLTLLHLSDLHFRSGQDFDRSVVLDPLLKRIRIDAEKGLKPELVVVSGDIVFSGKRDEYLLAKAFFRELLDSCGLESSRLFIVPGNHDVDRDEYPPIDNPKYDDMQTLNIELENPKYRAQRLSGMNEYFAFINDGFGHLTGKSGSLVPFVSTYESSCGKTIGLVGLNSAWMCRKRNESPGDIAVGEFQVKNAFKQLSEKGMFDLAICVFHHPLSWLWREDRKIVRTYLNDTVLLTGHLHETEAVLAYDLEGKLWQFQAGGAYLDKGSEDKWPARYQYITFDWDDRFVRLDFRKFVRERHLWVVDSDTGDDGSKEFPGFGTSEDNEDIGGNEKQPLAGAAKAEDEEPFRLYIRAALGEHGTLSFCGFETTFRFPVQLERIYVNLRAYIGAHDDERTCAGKEKLHDLRDQERFGNVDIKGAFAALKHFKLKDMVILGDPGSGKTTLLKLILVTLIESKSEETFGISSRFIPFFALLRMWKPGTSDFYSFMEKACSLESFGITRDSFEGLLKRGSAIILLDGLDEAGDKKKRGRLISFFESVRKRYPDTRFIFTSRFAGYMGKERFTGNIMDLSIQDFDIDQIKAFLYNWFSSVEEAIHPAEKQWQDKARGEAEKLIAKITESESLTRFVKNP